MIDPVCIIHGKKMSEHNCLYCCLCFKSITPSECWTNEKGQKENICIACAKAELKLKEKLHE